MNLWHSTHCVECLRSSTELIAHCHQACTLVNTEHGGSGTITNHRVTQSGETTLEAYKKGIKNLEKV